MKWKSTLCVLVTPNCTSTKLVLADTGKLSSLHKQQTCISSTKVYYVLEPIRVSGITTFTGHYLSVSPPAILIPTLPHRTILPVFSSL